MDDKFKLLDLLEVHGPENMEAIIEGLPFKSFIEINDLIKKYERKAKESYYNKGKESDEAPMDEWITVLTHLSTKNSKFDPLHRVLKYIALFEEHNNEEVDISACYQFLSDLLKGSHPKELTDDTLHFFNNCIVAMARDISSGDCNAEKEYLKNLNLEIKLPEPRTYSRKDRDTMASLSALNVLHVPEDLLNK